MAQIESSESPKEFEQLLTEGECNPIVVKEQEIRTEQPRKFFRITFDRLLVAEMTILALKGKKIDLGKTSVLIKNIGPGGLCFFSNIRFPIEQDMVLQFMTQLLGKDLKVFGCPVWVKELDDNLNEYGVKFTCDENERSSLVKELSLVQVRMKNNHLFADGSFVSGPPAHYFKSLSM